MAEADWTKFTAATNGALDDGDVSKGVSNAFTAPADSGANDFVQGFHSLQSVIGFAGWYYSGLSAFNPIPPDKGGRISGALRRYSSGEGYAPMIGMMSGTHVATAKAYIIGLSDSNPYRIALKKGYVGGSFDPTDTTILRVSDESWTSTTKWFHLQLDVIVNPQGDVRLVVKQNDLDTEVVSSPNWQSISGMADYVDDSMGVLSGASPLTSGFRMFFGHFNNGEAGKVSLIDHITPLKQK
ncbi:MAG: hypothetical protein ACYSUB_22380 [Planctomycetota bacterium]|jgi:hypothetical protein